MGGVNFWLQKTEVVMRIAIAEFLAFAYNLEYLLRLTKLKYTHIFIVDFHGSRIYQMKEKNHVFHLTHPLCYEVFEIDLSFKKNHYCMAKTIMYLFLYQSLKSYQSFHDPQLEGKCFTKSTLSNCIR